MKVLSKYKDYYDYLVGIYGMDEKLILDRRECDIINEYTLNPRTPEHNIINIAIGGWLYSGLVTPKDIVWGDNLKNYINGFNAKYMPKYLTDDYKRYNSDNSRSLHKLNYDDYGVVLLGDYNQKIKASKIKTFNYWDTSEIYFVPVKTEINNMYDCPIVYFNNESNALKHSDGSTSFYPKLKETNISSVLTPHEAWVLISNWLSFQLTKKEQKRR